MPSFRDRSWGRFKLPFNLVHVMFRLLCFKMLVTYAYFYPGPPLARAIGCSRWMPRGEKTFVLNGPVGNWWIPQFSMRFQSSVSYQVAGWQVVVLCIYIIRANSRFAPSQWEMALLCNDVSHWLGANLQSTLISHAIYLQSVGAILNIDVLFL